MDRCVQLAYGLPPFKLYAMLLVMVASIEEPVARQASSKVVHDEYWSTATLPDTFIAIFTTLIAAVAFITARAFITCSYCTSSDTRPSSNRYSGCILHLSVSGIRHV